MNDESLYDELMTRLVGDLDELGDAADLVDAALQGDAALAEALERSVPATPARAAVSRSAAPEAWLAKLTVAGFRGVGPEVVLDLDPGPGLVVIVGRNGCGKSSLSDGLEVLLTGQARRFEGKTVAWRTGWRNLHAPTDVRVALELAVQGGPPVVAERTWAEDAAEVDESALRVHRGSAATSLDELGWTRALDTYRPLLGTGELARGLDKGPAALFDALKRILGLGEVADAVARLKVVSREAGRAATEVRKQARALVARLREVDDPRAAEAAATLAKRSPDLDVIRRVVAGGGSAEDRSVGWLRGLSSLVGPDLEAVRVQLDELRLGLRARDEAGDAEDELSGLAFEVLSAALRWHALAGDGVCPACGVGALDGAWAERGRVDIPSTSSSFGHRFNASRPPLELFLWTSP